MQIEAVFFLCLARLALLTLPFRWIAARLGRPGREEPAARLPEDETANRIGSALRRGARHVPFKAECLVQAVAGKLMLARRDLPGTVYFGVNRGTEGALEAHAWLRCGDRVITGGRIAHRFAVIARFADEEDAAAG